MSKKTQTPDTPARRPRRASLPITPEAGAEIDAIAEAFGVPKSEVRKRAAALASEAVASKLRAVIGKERIEATRKELERLEDAAAGVDASKADAP
jgi:hypothetical protein